MNLEELDFLHNYHRVTVVKKIQSTITDDVLHSVTTIVGKFTNTSSVIGMSIENEINERLHCGK